MQLTGPASIFGARTILVSSEVRINVFRSALPGAPIWNVDAIKIAIARGHVRHLRLPFTVLPPMGDKERDCIDWPKVDSMIASWRAAPPANRKVHVINQPAIQVITRIGPQLHRVFVDGNHRTCARERLGKKFFESWCVDEDHEQLYRIEE